MNKNRPLLQAVILLFLALLLTTCSISQPIFTPTSTRATTSTRTRIYAPTLTPKPSITPTPLPPTHWVCVVDDDSITSWFPKSTYDLANKGDSMLGYGLIFAENYPRHCNYVLRLTLDLKPLGAKYTLISCPGCVGAVQYLNTGCAVSGEMSIESDAGKSLVRTVEVEKLPPEKLGADSKSTKEICWDTFRKTLISFLGDFWGPAFLIDELYASPMNYNSEIEEVLANKTGQQIKNLGQWKTWWKKQPTTVPASLTPTHVSDLNTPAPSTR